MDPAGLPMHQVTLMLELFHSPRARLAAAAWLGAAAAGFVFFALHTSAGFGGARLDNFSSVWVYDALEVLAVIGIAARAIFIASERAAWIFLAVAVASWTIGDLLWNFAYNGSPPFPSWSDVFYLGFYPPAYIGLALLVRYRLARFDRSIWLDGLMAALAVGALGAAVILDVVFHTTEGKLLPDAVNLAYPLGDIVLLALLAGVFGLARWRPGPDWTLIACSIGLTAIADAIYLYQSAVGSYVPGTILDALWPASLLLLVVAAWLPRKRKTKLALENRPLVATPVLAGAISLGVLIDSYVQDRNVVGVALAAAAILTVVARTVFTLKENERVTAATTTLALTDPLTGLWNRRKLLADLDRLFEPEPEHAPPRLLVLYDLNGFKSYNDSFGHPAGDLLLLRLGGKLAGAVGPNGSCYRLGGDEFCVLADVSADRIEALLTSTTDALGERGEGFDISTAFGCVFLPEETADPADALHIADQRLYAQKYQSLVRNGQPHRALVQALFEREPDLEDHITSVTRLSLAVARELGIDKPACEELELAAQLHDIGKLAIPDATLTKPGPLDDQERKLIEQHTLIGQRILSASPAFGRIALIVRATHESWDGSGYPDGLAGEEIPLAARIIAVCDAYSAITSSRAYRSRSSHKDALAEITSHAGTQFDPAVVETFGLVMARDASLVGV
jgi:two-component system cell cycle response regulator